MIVQLPDSVVLSINEHRFVEAMEALADAEVEEAEAFIAIKFSVNPPRSDWTARAQAAIETQGKVTRLKALATVYRTRMLREGMDVADSE